MKIKGLSITKYMFSIVKQKKNIQFYFQIDWSKKYILDRILRIKAQGGISTAKHLYTGNNYEAWKESELIGLFFDITICGIRLGVYLYPISYVEKKNQ